MDEELIGVCALATRIACQRMTLPHLKALRNSVEQACCLPAKSAWDRKVTAHAEIVNLLADTAADPILALLARNIPGELYDLMITVGPGTSGIIASSRRRLLALITAGDAEGAAHEMEQHLNGLLWMRRLAGGPSRPRDGAQLDGMRAAPGPARVTYREASRGTGLRADGHSAAYWRGGQMAATRSGLTWHGGEHLGDVGSVPRVEQPEGTFPVGTFSRADHAVVQQRRKVLHRVVGALAADRFGGLGGERGGEHDVELFITGTLVPRQIRAPRQH
jgi:hypothetical protein